MDWMFVPTHPQSSYAEVSYMLFLNPYSKAVK